MQTPATTKTETKTEIMGAEASKHVDAQVTEQAAKQAETVAETKGDAYFRAMLVITNAEREQLRLIFKRYSEAFAPALDRLAFLRIVQLLATPLSSDESMEDALIEMGRLVLKHYASRGGDAEGLREAAGQFTKDSSRTSELSVPSKPGLFKTLFNAWRESVCKYTPVGKNGLAARALAGMLVLDLFAFYRSNPVRAMHAPYDFSVPPETQYRISRAVLARFYTGPLRAFSGANAVVAPALALGLSKVKVRTVYFESDPEDEAPSGAEEPKAARASEPEPKAAPAQDTDAVADTAMTVYASPDDAVWEKVKALRAKGFSAPEALRKICQEEAGAQEANGDEAHHPECLVEDAPWQDFTEAMRETRRPRAPKRKAVLEAPGAEFATPKRQVLERDPSTPSSLSSSSSSSSSLSSSSADSGSESDSEGDGSDGSDSEWLAPEGEAERDAHGDALDYLEKRLKRKARRLRKRRERHEARKARKQRREEVEREVRKRVRAVLREQFDKHGIEYDSESEEFMSLGRRPAGRRVPGKKTKRRRLVRASDLE